MRGICEPVNKASMGEPKIWSWGLYSQWHLCKARADENWGEEHEPWGMCRAGRCTGSGPHASPTGPAQIYCLQGSEARALSGSWAVFELQGCWVKFPVLFSNITHAQSGHLLRGFSQKLLAALCVSEESIAQALYKATSLAGCWIRCFLRKAPKK